MKKYDSYKDSGIEGIGEIPLHWNIRKLKFVCKIFNGDSLKDEEKELYSQEIENAIPYVSTKDIDVWTSKINYENGLSIPIDHSRYKIAPKNSFLMCIEGGSAGRKYSHLEKDVFFVNKLACFETRSENNKFLYYYSQSPLFQSQFQNSLSGLIGGVAISQIRNFSVILPIPDEQTAIANFLDQKTTQIDDLIAKKERLIQLLEEERTAIINQAVTKGLDPTVPMKDSGVEWLGEIPAHWEVKPMKYIVKDLKSGVSVNSEDIPVTDDVQKGVLKTSCVYNYSFNVDENKQVVQLEYERVRCPVVKNSIIISRMNTPELVGASGFVEKDHPNLFLPDRLWITELYKNIQINVKWLSQILVSDLYRKTLASKATGTSPSMKNISKDDFLTLPIPYAPFVEQCKIAEFLSDLSEKVKKISSKTQEEIELLKEYKTALISEVVTGKVDVRNGK